ncbi:MAG TPA: hypothetical protein P5096_00755 [Patescibacteria group bacterium]|nr:hypothetical protein [Patescibacteria group bacterium]
MEKYIPKLKNWHKDFLWGNLFGFLFQIIIPLIVFFLFPKLEGLSAEGTLIGRILFEGIFGWTIAFISFLVETHTYMLGIKASVITIIFWGLIGILFGLVIRKIKNRRKNNEEQKTF